MHPRPIRSTILLYIADRPPSQPVVWGRKIATDLSRAKLGRLSPNTVYKVLEDFRGKGLVEYASSEQSTPNNPVEASVTTMSETEAKRQQVIRQFQRAGLTQPEIEELEIRRARRGGLARIKPREIKSLIQARRSTGLSPPDPRARWYRLTSYGQKIAELLKQRDLLTKWWPTRGSPTDNPDFVQKLHAIGLEPEHIDTARRARILRTVEGEPENRPQKYAFLFEGPPNQAFKVRRHRYELM